MKQINLITLTIAATLSAVPAFGQGPAQDYAKILSEFKKDAGFIEGALSSTDFNNAGERAKGYEQKKDSQVQALSQSVALVGSLQTRASELTRHFAAVRTGGASGDDPKELETFCSTNSVKEWSQESLRDLLADAFDKQRATFVTLQGDIDPIASDDFWVPREPTDAPLPGGYDPGSQSAREYLYSQREAQLKVNRTKSATQQRLLDAVTHAGWAATRLTQMKWKAMGLVQALPGSTPEGDPQAACRLAVARIQERAILAGTSGRAPAGKPPARTLAVQPK